MIAVVVATAVWILFQAGYDGTTKATFFHGPQAEQMCEAARNFLTLTTRYSYCVDP